MLDRWRMQFWTWVYCEAMKRVDVIPVIKQMAEEEVDKVLRERIANMEDQAGRGFVSMLLKENPKPVSLREQRNVRLARTRR
jgi:hypothetical protein